MIFSSQLGKLDGQNTEQSLKTVSNHVRKMQEELEYRLSVLDSSNINEINADETNILTGGKNINNVLADQNGNMSALTQTVNGLSVEVSNQAGDISTLQVTADGLSTTVASQAGDITALRVTADGLNTTVSNQEGKISALQVTADGLSTTVSSQEGKISALQVTADGLSSTVASQGRSISSLQTTSDSISGRVSSLSSELSTTLTLDASGVYITDYYGNTVSINGGQIDADTVRVNNLYGSTVYLRYGNTIIGELDISYTTSGFGVAIVTRYGGIQLNSAGNVSITPGSGYYVGIGSGGRYVSIQADLQPSSSSYSCGTSSYPWSAVYASSGEISTSDREKKNSIDYDTTAYEALFDNLKPCSFKLNDGTSDRRHVGMIAQDVEAAMEAAGLSTQDFAGFVKAPRKDEDENVIEGEYDYFLRYSEFMGLCIGEIQKLKARVAELEAKKE